MACEIRKKTPAKLYTYEEYLEQYKFYLRKMREKEIKSDSIKKKKPS